MTRADAMKMLEFLAAYHEAEAECLREIVLICAQADRERIGDALARAIAKSE